MHFIGKNYFSCLPFVTLFVNVILIALVVFGVIPGMFVGVSFFIFVFIASLFSGKITKIQSQYWKNLRALRAYAEQMALVESRRFSSPLLVKLQKRFSVADGNRRASELLADCTKMLDTLDQRNNIIAYVLLNGFMLWELLQIMNIERWRKSYAASLILWIETVGEFEAYSSLATFSFNNSSTNVFPQILDGDFHLNCEAVGHPLLHRDRCVPNDVMLSANPSFMVVTGANMAGKSTYLRTVGVNFLLACVGASVCAKSMSVAPVPLFTSLRTTDSLADNESYFFAELKRLSRIVDTLNRGGRLFIILDEILKGTNSLDKQRGSLALVKQFVSKGANGIIATHDVLLGSLAEQLPGKVENFCFEADIIDNELVFGYKMRRGIVQNMNACFLMKKMGIDVSD